MGHDSRKTRSRSEAPTRSRTHHSGGSTHQQPAGRLGFVPSRLSQVTNAGDLSDAEAAPAEGSHRTSGSTQTPPYAPLNLTFGTLGAWLRQGGRLEMLDDKTREALLREYLQSEDASAEKSKKKTTKNTQPPAAILEEEESDDGGGVSLNASSSHKKDKGKGDKGKGRAR